MRRRAFLSKGFVAILMVLAFAAGYATSVSLTVSSGSELGTGTHVRGNYLTWWTETAVASSAIPSPAPSSVSTTVGSPTVLPTSAASFVINSATANHKAVVWNFTETTAAPVNTEVEIVLTATVGSPGTTTKIQIYVETQATAITSAVVISFYFDAGTGVLIVDATQQLSQECASTGNCP